MSDFAHSASSTRRIEAADAAVFRHLDDHRNHSAHMGQRSWAMMGSRMEVHMDAGGTRAVGSRSSFTGSFLGIPLAVEKIVIERDPPRLKTSVTVRAPTLWVIGRYRMGFSIIPGPHRCC